MINEADIPEGATPLDPDESAGLIPGLTTRSELNSFEQANIAQALAWARRSRKLKNTLLTVSSLKLLHQKMFDDTWIWAGIFRTSGKNIGVEPYLIQTQLANLCADGDYWLKNNVFPIETSAIRFHHRLVSIHPFPNGNGRHSRLVADLLMIFNGSKPFSWGGENIDYEGDARKDYLSSLRSADRGNYEPLIEFAKRR